MIVMNERFGSRRLYLNAFTMNGISHQSPGLWSQPEDRMVDYRNLDKWIELARLLESGK